MKRMLFMVLFFCFGLSVIAACQSNTPGDEIPAEFVGLENPFAGDDNAAGIGMAVYEEKCRRCHGTDAHGKGNAPDLVEAANSHNEDYLFWWVSAGGEGFSMPAFSPELSDDEIWQVITFLQQAD